MTEWKDIKTAPKDGTVVRVKNGAMQHPVLAKWAKYKSTSPALSFIPAKDQWVLVKDEHEKFMPLPPGTLVIPDQWQPI